MDTYFSKTKVSAKTWSPFVAPSVTFRKKPIYITKCPDSNIFNLSADCADSANLSSKREPPDC